MNSSYLREGYKITWIGLIVNAFLGVLKIGGGIFGRSSALVVDGVHSFSDMLTDIITIIGLKIAVKPEDETHNFGHGKYETFASFIISLLLLATGIEFGYNGINKLIKVIHGQHYSLPSPFTLIIALISIVSKEILFRYTKNVGKKLNSGALEANAYHHRSDALSSVAVVIGLGIILILGEKFIFFDSLIAIFVSIMILLSAIGILKSSTDELVETSLPDNIVNEIKRIVSSNKCIVRIEELKTRKVGLAYVFDITVTMDGNIKLDEAHYQTTLIEEELKKRFPDAYIIIHVEPDK